MKRILLVCSMAVLAGCGTTKLMDGIMSSWEGEHIEKAIDQWGYPTAIHDFRGNKLYRWDYTKSAVLPQTTTVNASSYQTGPITTFNGTATTTGGHTLHGICTRILEVNPKDIIVKWQWDGNNCPFWEAMEYTKWRNPASVKGQ